MLLFASSELLQIASLPGLQAILIISAHWENPGIVKVNSAARPSTIHDFYGFPRELYSLEYPATGSPKLAAQVVSVLQKHGIPAELDSKHGLDHGAWVPLRWMLPHGDIPVVQMSLRSDWDMRQHVELGLALRELRKEGVLVVGSGGAVHNLRDFRKYLGTDKVRHLPLRMFSAWNMAELIRKA